MTRVLILALHPGERGLLLGLQAQEVGRRHVVGQGAGDLFEVPASHLTYLDEVIDLPRRKFFTTEGELAWIYQLASPERVG